MIQTHCILCNRQQVRGVTKLRTLLVVHIDWCFVTELNFRYYLLLHHFVVCTEGCPLPSWCLHLVVVGELECPNDPESYAAGSVATGRVTLGGQVEG